MKFRLFSLASVVLLAGWPSLAADPPAKPRAAATATLPNAPATQVSPLVVEGRTVVPVVGTGAPLFSVDELKAAETVARRAASDARFNRDLCGGGPGRGAPYDRGRIPTLSGLYAELSDLGLRLVTASQRAEAATSEASAARVKATSGTPEDAQDAIDAELRRQQAVNAFVASREAFSEARSRVRDLMDLMKEHEHDDAGSKQMAAETYRLELESRSLLRTALHAPEEVAIDPSVMDLVLTDVTAQPQQDGRKAAIRVAGLIHNPRDKDVRMPPLSLTALDATGFKLSTLIADPLGRPIIPAHKAIRFAYDFEPRPQRAASVFLTFADDGYRPIPVPASYFCRANRGG